jgi:hypothetical protein
VALVLTGFALAACGRGESRSAQQTTPSQAVTQSSATTQPTTTAAITPSPTAIVTPTLDVAQLVGAQALPDTVSPFTGLEVDNPTELDHMAAAVKISNSPIARPQSGLSKADVVVEHLAEGGITRFTAIFHSEDAERIGSVRSARLIDLEIPVLFDAFLVYSGASGEVNRLIESSDFAATTLSDERNDPGFYRLAIPGKTYEHTLFTDTELLQQVAQANGWIERPRARGWTWSDQPSVRSKPAGVIEIPYNSEYSDVRYVFDKTTGKYERWILDEPHIDDLTGEQLATSNVAVLYANHVPTLIVEDVLGSKSIEIQLWGQGRMQLFRDGRVQEGYWLRPNREDPLLLLDSNYKPLPLKPGKTWIEIVPLDMQITTSP